MPTLRQFAAKPETIPATTAWYPADLGEAGGKQALFTKQSPQRLRVLREHTLIESAVSSNRIEGVIVDQARISTLVFGRPRLRDRNEEEVRGYRNALNSVDMVRRVLRDLQKADKVECLGRGPGAMWRRIGYYP